MQGLLLSHVNFLCETCSNFTFKGNYGLQMLGNIFSSFCL